MVVSESMALCRVAGIVTREIFRGVSGFGGNHERSTKCCTVDISAPCQSCCTL